MVAAVKAAGLVDTLKGKGPFTVFAPTDAAFKKLPAGTVEGLLKPENKAKLAAILTYHVVPGKVISKAIAGKKLQAASVQGQEISIDATKGVQVDDAQVVKGGYRNIQWCHPRYRRSDLAKILSSHWQHIILVGPL